MVSRLYKCYGYCNEKYEKDILIKHTNGKNYCPACLEKMIKEQNDRNSLYNKIRQFYNVSYPTGMMLKQIKDYKEINGYTYKGMELTLVYCKEVLNLEFKSTMGVGIIPHQYEKAKQHFIEKQKRINNHKDVEIKEIVVNVRYIDTNNYYKKSKLINLEEVI